MKLIKIPFDASLIGQEGIVVKYRNGETPDFVKVYGNDLITVSKSGAARCHQLSGKWGYDHEQPHPNCLFMYRESKVMSVDEWVDNAKCNYKDYHWQYGMGAKDLAAAIKNGEVELP